MFQYVDQSGNLAGMNGYPHPDGTTYVAHRRDNAAGGKVLLVQQVQAGRVLRTLRAYATTPDGTLARETGGAPTQRVDGPLGAAFVACLPNGTVEVWFGVGIGGSSKWAYEAIVNGCAAFDQKLNWQAVYSATDDQARQQAAAAVSQVKAALSRIDSLNDRVNDIKDDIKDVPQTKPQPAVTDQHIADIAWQKGRDALQGLINEARANPNTSDLVMLIREVVAGKH